MMNKRNFRVFQCTYSALYGILMKLCILVYTLEITSICCNLNFYEKYTIFGVNSFSPEIMLLLADSGC